MNVDSVPLKDVALKSTTRAFTSTLFCRGVTKHVTVSYSATNSIRPLASSVTSPAPAPTGAAASNRLHSTPDVSSGMWATSKNKKPPSTTPSVSVIVVLMVMPWSCTSDVGGAVTLNSSTRPPSSTSIGDTVVVAGHVATVKSAGTALISNPPLRAVNRQ